MNNGNQEFSCGFFSHSLNFRVSGLTNSNQGTAPIYEALKNLLERGYPTRPTHYLEDKIRELHPEFSWSDQDLPESMMLRSFKPNWDDTIKGYDEKRLFPARTFFNDLIDEHLSGYSFIKNLIVPECKFGDILVDPIKAGASPDWAVDFFLPCADLVIEIDGSQHGNEKAKVSDAARDRIFRKYGIRTHRIETKKISENSDGIRNYFSDLKRILDDNKEIQFIKAFIGSREYDLKSINYDLSGLARLQRLLVALLEQKQIKNGTCLELKADFKPLLDWNGLALKDLKNTYDLLKFHFPSSPKFPEIQLNLVEEFSKSKDCIKIDLSVFCNVDDAPLAEGIISVRSSQLNFMYRWDSKEPKKIPKICASKSTFDGKIIKQKRALKNNLQQLNSIIFGLGQFRVGQFEIISSAIESHSVLGLLPTGGGKSLCFQSLGAIETGCTIVVCPITALIRDHVLELQQFGFNQRAEYVSAETAKDQDYIFQKLESGILKFLFLSPEQFQKPHVRQILARLQRNNRVSRFVIDEVHCISEWGHDFRTAYLNLAYTIEKFAPGIPILCLTATAAVKVIKDIQIEFKISDDDIVYRMDQSRTELNFRIQKTHNKIDDLQNILTDRYENDSINKTHAMIVFSSRVNDSRAEFGIPGISQTIRKVLKNANVGVFSGKQPKHFDLASEVQNISKPTKMLKNYTDYKAEIQKQFKANELDAIIATKAFGMGVNKPNVRLVVHYGMPQSLETLYQEAGRAGRDKKPADCITLFTPGSNVPDSTHSAETTMEALELIQKKIMDNGGDLSLQLFFLTQNSKKIDAELQECIDELTFLRSFGSEGLVVVSDNLDQVNHNHVSDVEAQRTGHQNKKENHQSHNRIKEKIIFRLKQLGFVKDWAVLDFTKGIYEVDWTDQSRNMLADSIVKLIKKYSEAEDDIAKYSEKIKRAGQEGLGAEEALIRVLLEWNYEHFVYQRRQSLKNIYDACDSYENSDTFKQTIEAYFQTNKAFSELPNIINLNAKHVPLPIRSIILTKDGNLIGAAKRYKMTINLMKYLEAYSDNPGLNLLSSLLRLADDNFDDPDGMQRFKQYLDTFNMSGAEILELEPLVETLCKFQPNLAKQAFECIFEKFRQPKLAKMVLERTDSADAENILLQDINDRLEKVL